MIRYRVDPSKLVSDNFVVEDLFSQVKLILHSFDGNYLANDITTNCQSSITFTQPLLSIRVHKHGFS